MRLLKAAESPRGRRNVQRHLEQFVEQEEPELMRWLFSTWNTQAEAVSYQELRNAILAGQFDEAWLARWQLDYARFVVGRLAPAWMAAISDAGKRFEERIEGFIFNPAWQQTRRWISERSTELIRGLAETQHEAIRGLVARAALMGDYGPDELARVIRPLIGATPQEAQAVLRYHDSLRAGGMKAADAQKRALEYSQRVHRHRAMRIARTELAWAWNRGALAGALQAQEQGYFSTFDRIWVTAKDERVCPVCGPLDEVRVPAGAQFPGGFEAPPAHPQCRCSAAFEPAGPQIVRTISSSVAVPAEVPLAAEVTWADAVAGEKFAQDLQAVSEWERAKNVAARLKWDADLEVLSLNLGVKRVSADPAADLVLTVLKSWMEQSTSATSFVMQLAAKDEFGLGPVTFVLDRKKLARVRAMYARAQRGARELIRAIYDDTQESLSRLGIADVVGFRGLKRVRGILGLWPSQTGDGGETDHVFRPMSSFSAVFAVAKSFESKGGATLAARIPRARIIGWWRAGFAGYPTEYEFVVLGGPARVKWARGAETMAEFFEQSEHKVEKQQPKGLFAEFEDDVNADWLRIVRLSKVLGISVDEAIELWTERLEEALQVLRDTADMKVQY